MISGHDVIHLESAVSSVTFQQLVSYNVMFSAVYLMFGVLNSTEKINYVYAAPLNAKLHVPLLCIWGVAEAARIYCGFVGNLSERVPEMSAFLLISFFPQVPTLLFLTFLQEHTFPVDHVLGLIALGLIFVEVIVGVATFRRLILRQTAQFYRLCQEER